ncbi:FAD-binding oxidoreductase [Mesorhizobium sp. M7A.F.Ca.US.006.01.1.1]|uniref:FAD-binding oxidoreductase n=1 Tax=Mesorhizobium sp. M7A.F.Ca.US.006.01.1.1 TaxID=2496707 RepID=UPI000FC9CC15|nr:FAD-binding oxidoreductase [Mesorhizobium sp. M7A.F.Ca.US.006.01.1.1]RUZ76008.1 FAD-binding oxidoreductase [Mesorhizobium sp. M7A.F.Ca.US.006.01.1.1]
MFLQRLISELGQDLVLSDSDATQKYCRDWMGDVDTSAVAVLRPRSPADVSRAVVACGQLGLGIVPQGGNTGLVLGALPDDPSRQVILSLERLNRIRAIEPADFAAVVEAGCILANVKDAVAERGLFFPLALGAQGTCQIGGNVSTNAGGLNVLRYGMARDQIFGLEVVLPDGRIWNGLSALRKDNRGIDLKQFFIGSEGTLGIITAASIKLLPAPTKVATALLAVTSLGAAVSIYSLCRELCSDLMTAFEFMPPSALILAKEAMPDLEMPLAGEYPAYALMEISGSGLVDIDGLMEKTIAELFSRELLLDGVLSSSEKQTRNLWMFREAMIHGIAHRGRHLRTDISVALSKLPIFVKRAEALLARTMPEFVAISYGHVGDGNVHLDVIPPTHMTEEEKIAAIEVVKDRLFELVYEFDGSISAEHGIGREKRDDFLKSSSPVSVELLRAVKNAIDPAGIMNPGCQLTAD